MEKLVKYAPHIALAVNILIWVMLHRSFYPFLIIAAISVHELGHIVFSALLGNSFMKLSFQVGGLKLSGNGAYGSYLSEALVAFAGPLFNIITAALASRSSSPHAVFFVELSLAIAALNLLPVKELDGGRISEGIFSLILPLNTAAKLYDILSFLSVFFLWSISVYILMRTGRDITFFIFSATIFLRLLAVEHKTDLQAYERINENMEDLYKVNQFYHG